MFVSSLHKKIALYLISPNTLTAVRAAMRSMRGIKYETRLSTINANKSYQFSPREYTVDYRFLINCTRSCQFFYIDINLFMLVFFFFCSKWFATVKIWFLNQQQHAYCVPRKRFIKSCILKYLQNHNCRIQKKV